MATLYDPETLGWDSFFEKAFEPYRAGGYSAARVFLEYQGGYRVYSERGEILAEVTGRIRHRARGRDDYPAVGDWVVIAHQPGEPKARIHEILRRKSKFSRKAAGNTVEQHIVAANVDTVFLMQSLDRNYNLRRLERYLVVATESGARPVVVLNKADLSSDVDVKVSQVESVAGLIPVHAISSKTGEGVEQLSQYLRKGRTVAFLGSSGVGKSTLINRLVGRDIQRVQEVRVGDDRGRHTTRRRELIVLPSGGLLIDTPGMRELQLWEASDGLSDAFADVEQLSRECRFSDCSHRSEPECAIIAAVSGGRLSQERLENYLKMGKELEFLRSRRDAQASSERREKERRIHRTFRKIKPRRK